MSALDRKLGRDLWRLKGQVATIALVLACGIMAMIMLRSTWQSLLGARDSYYERFRFADVFARLERAPEAVALERALGQADDEAAGIDGVAQTGGGLPCGRGPRSGGGGMPRLVEMIDRTVALPDPQRFGVHERAREPFLRTLERLGPRGPGRQPTR